MIRFGTVAAAVAAAVMAWTSGVVGGQSGAGPAAAAQGAGPAPCRLGGTAPTMDSPAPFNPPAVVNNENFDCMAWQAFISLNWPALAGSQGVADPGKPLGTPGPTVWQTFATADQVFLANGARPSLRAMPGGARGTATASARRRLMAVAGVAGPRRLTQRSKLSPALLASAAAARPAVARATEGLRAGPAPAGTPLDEDTQADGNVLIDQNGQYVYYEELLNPVETDYIVTNRLYEAGAQNRFAASQAIAMPPGSIEVKAAWKILGAGDVASHYITAQAFIDGGTTPVTVGLVGLHMILRVNGLYQGVWASFSHIENAPVPGSPQLAHYAFNNPACAAVRCVPNAVTAAPTPTQVRQVFAPDGAASPVNTYVAGLVGSHPAAGAFAYYRLLNVQWPQSSTRLPNAPQAAPLPSGSPNTATLINPVLETFLQRSGMSCLGCHAGATTAAPPAGVSGPYASSFSFLLLHANAAPVR